MNVHFLCFSPLFPHLHQITCLSWLCLCSFKLLVLSRLWRAGSFLRNFEFRMCSFSVATLLGWRVCTPSQGGEGERMCWQSLTQWNWHSHYLILVATSNSLREQAPSPVETKHQQHTLWCRSLFTSTAALLCCSAKVKGIFPLLHISFQGSWTWS